MGFDDFCRCTPSEFRATYGAWTDKEERWERREWERTRMSCLCALQPWSKRQLAARDVMEFPWEAEEEEKSGKRNEESREEVLARYEATKARLGLG